MHLNAPGILDVFFWRHLAVVALQRVFFHLQSWVQDQIHLAGEASQTSPLGSMVVDIMASPRLGEFLSWIYVVYQDVNPGNANSKNKKLIRI